MEKVCILLVLLTYVLIFFLEDGGRKPLWNNFT